MILDAHTDLCDKLLDNLRAREGKAYLCIPPYVYNSQVGMFQRSGGM